MRESFLCPLLRPRYLVWISQHFTFHVTYSVTENEIINPYNHFRMNRNIIIRTSCMIKIFELLIVKEGPSKVQRSTIFFQILQMNLIP